MKLDKMTKPNNPNHMDNLKGRDFSANPQNINKEGRPKKIYTILKEKGYSADDIRTAFGELAWYNKAELEEVQSDDSKPMITRIVAGQFIAASSSKSWTKIHEIMEHIIGKPRQTIDANIGTQKADLDGIFPTVEELEDDELNGPE